MTGVVIFFPPTTRAATAIFICVFCVMILNLYQPHRNKMVFHVAQLSFFLSTFKYLVAVLMISDSGMRATDRKFLGGLLVSLDILFMLGSFCAMAVIVYLLRRSLLRIRAAEQTKKTLIQPEQNPEQKRV